MTYPNIPYSKLIISLLFILLISSTQNVAGDGAPAVESDYDGPPLIIPLINTNPVIDGIANEDEFPEQGHLNLPGFLDEVKISHNNTALFLAITVDSEEFVGFATLSRGGHGESVIDFAYFLVGINENQTEQTIRVAESDYHDPVEVGNTEMIFLANVTEEDDTRVYELMISIANNDDRSENEFDTETLEDHDPLEDLIPKLGTIFNLIILNGEGEDITSLDVSKSSIIPAYLLREGEDANEIEELLENNPSWTEVLVFPIILFSLSVYFVWKYELIDTDRGEN